MSTPSYFDLEKDYNEASAALANHKQAPPINNKKTGKKILKQMQRKRGLQTQALDRAKNEARCAFLPAFLDKHPEMACYTCQEKPLRVRSHKDPSKSVCLECLLCEPEFLEAQKADCARFLEAQKMDMEKSLKLTKAERERERAV